jgi:hypothetical protein
MQKKLSLVSLALLAIAGSTLSSCASLQHATTQVKGYMRLPANEIAAPVGQMQMFRTADQTAEQTLSIATAAAVKALIGSLEQPLSLTAPISVHTLTSLNPEIISKNRFGSVAASHVGAAMTAEGYTVNGKSTGEDILKNRATITGTYSQSGTTVTFVLEIADASEKKVLGSHEYTLRVDGALRKLLDS